MRIERARLRDVPALLWVAAQAFAAVTTRDNVPRRALSLYLMHVYSLAVLAGGGRVWQWEKKVIIAIEPKNHHLRRWWLVLSGICSAVVMGLVGMDAYR